MTDLNVVTVIGRLVRDCGQQEFSYLQSGTAVAKISIAVNRSKKQNDGSWVDEASFFDVAIFGRTAENLHPYLQKGKQVAVKGYLKQDRWQDKQTGVNKSKISIIADDVQLVGGGNNNAPQYNPQTVYPTAQAAQMASAQSNPQQYAPPQNQAPQQQYQQISQNQPMQGNFPPPNDGEFPEDVPW